MSKFILVQQFDPEFMDYGFDIKPFWINIDLVSKVMPYQIEIHSPVKFDSIANKSEHVTPEGAKDTVYIAIDRCIHHLDEESSNKVLNAIGAREGMSI